MSTMFRSISLLAVLLIASVSAKDIVFGNPLPDDDILKTQMVNMTFEPFDYQYYIFQYPGPDVRKSSDPTFVPIR